MAGCRCVPAEAEISASYHAVWKARRVGDVVLIKPRCTRGSGLLLHDSDPDQARHWYERDAVVIGVM